VVLLKTLLEDGEMLLGDGRRVLSPERAAAAGIRLDDSGAAPPSDVLVMHRDFRMIVLANRPGFPFLGNDFFREAGDAFAVHVLDNPDAASEVQLLKAYAPNLAASGSSSGGGDGGDGGGAILLGRVAGAFADLRELHSGNGSSSNGGGGGGSLAYPYSMREAVAVVKHLEAFPRDGIVDALENVLAFDAFAPDTRRTVAAVFQAHGIPLPLEAGGELGAPVVSLGAVAPLLPPRVVETWRSNPGAGSGGSGSGGGGGGGGGL